MKVREKLKFRPVPGLEVYYVREQVPQSIERRARTVQARGSRQGLGCRYSSFMELCRDSEL